MPGFRDRSGGQVSACPRSLGKRLLVLVGRRSTGGADQNNNKGNVGDDEEQGDDAQHQTDPAGDPTDGCLSPVGFSLADLGKSQGTKNYTEARNHDGQNAENHGVLGMLLPLRVYSNLAAGLVVVLGVGLLAGRTVGAVVLA